MGKGKPPEDDILRSLRLGKSLVYKWVERPFKPEPGPTLDELDVCETLRAELKSRGISRLYKFQARAMDLISKGRSVVIVAGTGTGKTEAFLIPVLNELCRMPARGVYALVLYPTKALTADQYARWKEYSRGMLGVRVAIYDGDTSESERRRILDNPPQILLSNPDMLHFSLSSMRFRYILRNLRYVILDDIHVYHGVFGAHVAYVLRRLKRVVGRELQFIGASATIKNPGEFASRLFGEPVESVVEAVGRPQPVLHVMVMVRERSRHTEALRIAKNLAERGMKVLIFGEAHRTVELLGLMARRFKLNFHIHRAGLTREERRRVEEMFKRGEISGVISTPTLELGIDIGDLDAVVLDGVPPTYTRYIQRSGRCGRSRPGYVFMVMGEDPISSYYAARPEEYYSREPDELPLDLSNEEIAKHQLLSMILDRPLSRREVEDWMKPLLAELEKEGLIRFSRGRWFATPRSRRVFYSQTIRGVGDQVEIVLRDDRLIGQRELPMAIRELHPEAVYLHGGRIYRVLELELSRKPFRAVVERLPDDYGVYTTPLYLSMPSDLQILEETVAYGTKVYYGRLRIDMEVHGYVRRRAVTGEKLDEVALQRPVRYSFKTRGLYMKLPVEFGWSDMENAEAFHAIEHALIEAAQLVVGAGQTDLGGISFPDGTIIIYDSAKGGSGVSKLLLKRMEKDFQAAYRIVSGCDCEDGCPKCIFSPYCGNNNQILSRRKAAHILSKVISGVRYVYPPEFAVSGSPIV